jgi:nucleotide-binding universal stress UspA family protein
VIGVASIGKFGGALVGGLLGGLTTRESLALATGLNARGSTEVVIASIGLAMGALSQELYTMVVAMAVVTTMVMPPSLRWVMAHVPVGEDELRRMEKEAAELTQNLPKMERALVYVDDSPNGRLAAALAGLFAARQQVMTTVLEGASADARQQVESATRRHLATAAKSVEHGNGAAAMLSVEQLVQSKPVADDDALEKEVAKGYDIAFVGLDKPIAATAPRFDERLQRLLSAFDGPVSITVNGAGAAGPADVPLDILLPTGGSQDAGLATEMALALAQASGGTVTALHVFDPQEDTQLLRGRSRRQGMSMLVNVRRLGKRSGVPVKGLTATNSRLEDEIRRTLRGGRFDLVVLGASLRQGESKFLGPRVATLLRAIRTPALLIAR